MRKAMTMNNDRLHHRLCKVMTDGSIQGFTARLKWPGYFNGRPNGLWNMEPAQLAALIMRFHEAGMHLHIHTNGDEASELMLDAIEAAQRIPARSPPYPAALPDGRRQPVQAHAQARCLCQSVRKYVHYWGDQHAAITMGPTARGGWTPVPQRFARAWHAIHSDAPVTPMAPLFTAWWLLTGSRKAAWFWGRRNGFRSKPRCMRSRWVRSTLRMDHLIGSQPGSTLISFSRARPSMSPAGAA